MLCFGIHFLFFLFFLPPESQSFDHSAYAQCKQSLTACKRRIRRFFSYYADPQLSWNFDVSIRIKLIIGGDWEND
jgi:hypothetical protein